MLKSITVVFFVYSLTNILYFNLYCAYIYLFQLNLLKIISSLLNVVSVFLFSKNFVSLCLYLIYLMSSVKKYHKIVFLTIIIEDNRGYQVRAVKLFTKRYLLKLDIIHLYFIFYNNNNNNNGLPIYEKKYFIII